VGLSAVSWGKDVREGKKCNPPLPPSGRQSRSTKANKLKNCGHKIFVIYLIKQIKNNNSIKICGHRIFFIK
jgi:hypothetical protein